MSNRTSSEENDSNRYNVRALDRALGLLSVLADGKPRSLAELSAEVGLSPSTTFRLLATLHSYRYVRRDESSGQYRLGLASLELARAFYESNDLRTTALEDLRALRDEVKETIHLAVLDQMEVVYLEKLPGLYTIGMMGSRVGGRAPAYCTGVGKALLAYQDPDTVSNFYTTKGLIRHTSRTISTVENLLQDLEVVRQRGYALDNGEHEQDVRCIAAPIFNMSGEAVAALSISGPAGRMEPLESKQDLIQKALQSAQAISQKLGFHPRPADGQDPSSAKFSSQSKR